MNASDAQPPDAGPANPSSDPLTSVLKEILADNASHRLCVIAAHGFLELLINTFIEANCKHGRDISSRSRDYTHSAKLVILHELGLISDREFRVLDWFRKLRNRAAHEPLFEISARDLELFHTTEFSDTKQFHLLCVDLVGGFWNRHVELFGPQFMANTGDATQ